MRRLPLRSPPRMRGKVIVRSRNAVQIGITPAYAGKSARILKRRTEKRDHPRVCGEKLKFGTNVTKNPFSATFGSLDGLAVAGVWNAEQARVEF